MHPGWCDTEAVRTSLPAYYERMKPRLRSAAQGADSVLWLCTAPEAKVTNGGFHFDRRVCREHLKLSGTRYAPEQAAGLADKLRAMLAGLAVQQLVAAAEESLAPGGAGESEAAAKAEQAQATLAAQSAVLAAQQAVQAQAAAQGQTAQPPPPSPLSPVVVGGGVTARPSPASPVCPTEMSAHEAVRDAAFVARTHVEQAHSPAWVMSSPSSDDDDD
jgi:hypothetical protein